LIRHLNHKFPKLFQIATIQSWQESGDGGRSLFKGSHAQALEVTPEPTLAGAATPGLRFTPLVGKPDSAADRLLVFPHNPVDLPAREPARRPLLEIRRARQAFRGARESRFALPSAVQLADVRGAAPRGDQPVLPDLAALPCLTVTGSADPVCGPQPLGRLAR